MLTTRFFSLLLMIITHTATAQNLVPNGSFEEFENGCPESFNGTTALGWSRWLGSPDLFSTCVEPQTFNDSLGWVPWNGLGWQWPSHGDSYAGLFVHGAVNADHTINFREYLGCALLEPLIVGETYYVSFKTSLAFGNYYGMNMACSRLGAYFTTQDYLMPNNPLPIPNFAHVYEENIISDTLNWVTISGSFVADQPYTHMGLGVFFDFDLIDTLSLLSFSSTATYYYIDEVCVSPFPDCDTWVGTSEPTKFSLSIYPNPANNTVAISGSEPLTGIRVMAINGKELQRFEISGINNIEIPISDLPNGVYMVEVRSTKGYKREKLMVLR